MAAKKKISKVSKKKVTKARKKQMTKARKKQMTKASSVGISRSPLDAIDREFLFKDFENPPDELRNVFLDGLRCHWHAKLNAENGEFRGDFTRETFDPCDTFSKVLMQQGRVQLDADWNEQNSIVAHRLRSLANDVGGQHWGPDKGSGFNLNPVDSDEVGLFISPGHYYVNGILCEAGLNSDGGFITYTKQPYYPLPEGQTPKEIKAALEANQQLAALVYLDVWERHYNYVNDDSIREVALAGPDTATRAQIVWQVKVALIPAEAGTPSESDNHRFKEDYQDFLTAIDAIIKPGTGKLSAKVKEKNVDDTDPCLVAPDSRYRGAENQLYRVEVHRSGLAGETGPQAATFKWSRENSSVIFPITKIDGDKIAVEHLGKDCRYGLKPNDWVEIVDDDYVLQCRADSLMQVESIDEQARLITLTNPSQKIVTADPSKHPYLRRWDQKDGDENGIALPDNSAVEQWFELEDGIQVQFKGGNANNPANYQTGDYWLIPARTITGDIEWPASNGQPQALSPHGVVHHYAPLAIFGPGQDNDGDGDSDGGGNFDLRRTMIRTWS